MDPDKRIAWRSGEDGEGEARTSGQVTSNSLPDKQTEVTVVLQYATSVLRDRTPDRLLVSDQEVHSTRVGRRRHRTS